MAAAEQSTAPGRRCANPDCNVATDGRCVEGFADIDTCPQFGKVPSAQSDARPSEIEQPRPGVPLSPSKTLALADAEAVLRNRTSRAIAIVGPHDAGKTSLIAGLYDLFQNGPVQEFAFARSLTLQSFERACHDSRAASRNHVPHMERTQRGEVRFYHLDLIDQTTEGRAALLLGDRAGEEYFETLDDPDTAASFPELRRSDTVTVLVDGDKLLHLGLRHNVKSDVRMTLQAFIDAGAVKPWQRLALVLTKLDKVRSSAEFSPRAFADFESIVQVARSLFEHHFTSVEAFQVAASPQSDTAQRGEGLAELLRYWMEIAPRYEPKQAPKVVANASRAFDRLRAAT